MAGDDDNKKDPAREKLADQRKLKDNLKGALLAGRVQASTAKVQAPGAKTNAQAAAIPPPPKAPAAKPVPAKAPPPKPAVTTAKTKAAPPAKAKEIAREKHLTKGPGGKKRVAWDRKRLQKFVAGIITLAELEGISKDQQYQMAKLGHQLLRQGKLTDAKKVFEGLVTLDPRDAYFHLALGSIAQRANDLKGAERSYTRALELNPFNAPARANRGEVLMLQGRMVDGAKDLLRALQDDPEEKFPSTKRARATLTVVQSQLREVGGARPPPPKRTR
jgi:tetratricopeptide (TPR) repeat protein